MVSLNCENTARDENNNATVSINLIIVESFEANGETIIMPHIQKNNMSLPVNKMTGRKSFYSIN